MTPLRISELERRLANPRRVGTIAEANFAEARVRVQLGGNRTFWLPWLTTRAGGDRSWWAPEVGEQVLVLSPSGDLLQGIVLPALYSDAKPAPASVETMHRTIYADGAVIEYDRAAHRLHASIPGAVELEATGNVTATVGGNLSATVTGSASVNAATISLQASGAVTIQGANISLQGPVTASSTVAATGGVTSAASMAAPSVSAGSVSLSSHKHTGVTTGTGQTGNPV